MNMLPFIPRFRQRIQCAYTLIEVLAATTVMAVAMSAMVSLSSTLMIQEDLSWRVAVARNYQENMARVWQLGISSQSPSIRTVMGLMPDQLNNPVLNRILNGIPTITPLGETNPSNLGRMETAFVTAAVNISLAGNDSVETNAQTLVLTVYRPRLITELRPKNP